MKKLFVYLTILGVLSGCSGEDVSYRRAAVLMGTVVRIDIRDNIDRRLSRNAYRVAVKHMERLTGILDYFRERSDVARINKFGGKEMVRVSGHTVKIVKYAQDVYKKTGGAFDITVAPLVELWGFYSPTIQAHGRGKKRNGSLIEPPEDEIARLLENVDSDKIILDTKTNSVGFAKNGMKVDLGGIAKGYIVDEGIRALKKQGIRNALVEAGGDIYCMGRAGNKPWRIGIRNPDRKNEIIGIIELADTAVTTSGSYENFIVIENRVFHHIMNPKTGYPAENEIRSVTIVGPTCTEADAMATAVFVLGEKKGLELIEGLDGFDCIIISGGKTDYRIITTKNIKDKIKLL